MRTPDVRQRQEYAASIDPGKASDAPKAAGQALRRPTSDANIAIIGAGLMGRVLACFLLGKGYRVSLFDRDPIRSGRAAAYTAAGMLAPWAELEEAETDVHWLGLRSLALWPELLTAVNSDVDFHRRGSLVVAHPGDRGEFRRFGQRLAAKLGDSGQCRSLDREALAALEPCLAERFEEALFLPGEAWLDSRRAMTALARFIRSSGGQWHERTEVTSLADGVVSTAHGQHRFDRVIDCRGLGARADIADLRGVRGEVLWLRCPRLRLGRPVRLLHPRYRLYLVPRRDDIYVLGATQIESEDDGPVTVRSVLELLSAAYSLHWELEEARVVHSEANCRPALDDNLPRISDRGGVLRVNGLFRHGWLLAPALAEQVVHRISGTGAATDNGTTPYGNPVGAGLAGDYHSNTTMLFAGRAGSYTSNPTG